MENFSSTVLTAEIVGACSSKSAKRSKSLAGSTQQETMSALLLEEDHDSERVESLLAITLCRRF